MSEHVIFEKFGVELGGLAGGLFFWCFVKNLEGV